MSIYSVKNDNLSDSSFATSQVPVPPVVRGYSISGMDDTALDPAGGQTILINGSGFQRGATVTLAGESVSVVTWISSNQLSFTSTAKSAGTYTIYVVNPDGGTGVYIPGLIYSTLPTWTTGAGSLGQIYETKPISSTLVASGDAPITYQLASGTLPTGTTLSSSGVLSGTAPVDSGSTTYTFTVEAIDAQNQSSTRSFSLTINTDVVTWVNPAPSATIISEGATYSTTLNATSAAGYSIASYTADTLPPGLTLTNGVISGTPSAEGNTSTTLTATSATTGRTATNTISWVVILGDAYWNYVSVVLSATTTTRSYIDDASINNATITAIGDARPNNFNPYSPGYYSFNFATKTNYVSVPATTALTTFTGDFTFEAWVNPTDTTITYWGIWDSRQSGATASPMVFSIAPLASPVTGQGRLAYYNGTSYYGTGIVYYNQWNHVAFVRSGSTLTYYINGIAGGTSTISGTQTGVATTNPIYIGSKDNGLANYGTVGYINNFRIVNGTAVYTGNFTPSTTPLPVIANTVLLTAQNGAFVDSSAANGVLTSSSVAISGFTPFTAKYVKNTPNYSGYFDGNGDYLTVPSNTKFYLSSGDFTVEAWVYKTTTGKQIITSQTQNTGSPYAGWIMYVDASSKFTFEGTNGSLIASTSTTVPLNTWTHLAAVKSGSNMTLYQNGVSVNTSASPSITDYSTVLSIGNYSSYVSGADWAGSISNLRITKGQALYTSTFTPSTSPLTTTSQGATASNVSLLTCQSSTFRDNSTNNLTITVNGDARPIPTSPFADPGYSSTAITTYGSAYFDGTGDYLSIPSSGAFDFNGDFTMEAWIYPTAINTNNVIISRWTTSLEFIFKVVTGARLYFAWYIGATGIITATSTTVQLNQWNHVAVTRSGSTVRLFVNGVLDATTGTASGAMSSTSAITISSLDTTNTENFTGNISNLRVVKGTALYTANFTPPTNPLTAVSGTSLLTCQTNQPANNNVFIDSSTNNFAITRVGNTTQGSFSPYGENWSNYFNGSTDALSWGGQTQFALGTGDFTIEFWLNLSSYNASNSTVLDFRPASTNGAYPTIYVDNTGVLYYYANTANQITGSTLARSTWYHVAITRSGTSTRMFVNGSQVGTTYTDSTNYLVGASRPVLATNGFSTGSYAQGYISNFRVVKGTAVYTGAFTPPTAPLQPIAGTSLLTCQSPSFVDKSANNFTITVIGTPTVQKFGPLPGTTLPVPNYSGYFDGSGDYVYAPNTTSNFGTGDFTIECWVYKTGVATTVAGNQDGGTDSNYWLLDAINAQATFQIRDATNQAYAYGPAITDNTWTHLAVTRSGGSVRVFVNGVSGTPVTITKSITSRLTIIGAFLYTGYLSYFPGYISNFRIVKGQALYTANFTPSTAPLTTTSQGATASNVSLLTCQSNTFVDNSPNNFAITTAGDSKPSTFSPFTTTYSTKQPYTTTVFGGSMYFDGTGDYLSIPDNGAFDFGTDNFTVELWTYKTTTGDASFVMGSGGASMDFAYIAGTLRFGRLNTAWDTTITYTLLPNTWYHLAYVKENNVAKVYVNGTLVGSGSNTVSYTVTSGNLYIGVAGDLSRPIAGYISDVRLTRGKAVYTSNFVPQNQPLTPINNTVLLVNGISGDVIDASSNSHLETLGDAKTVQFGPYNAGYYSAYFDGTGDNLTVAAGSGDTVTDFTVSAWVYRTASAATQQDFIQIGTEAAGRVVFFWNASNFQYNIFGGSSVTLDGTSAMPTNQWVFVKLTRTGSSLSLYYNGTLINTVTLATSFGNTSGTLRIGNSFTGYISDLEYSATYLSNPATVPTLPRNSTANTKVLMCQSNRFIDLSSNAYAITPAGDTKIRTQNPWQNNSGQSVYFDGTGDYLASFNLLNSTFGTGDYTVEAWIYRLDAGVQRAIIDTRGSGGVGLLFYITSNNKLNVFDSTSVYITSTNTVPINQWVHVAVTRSSGTTRLFINGAVEATLASDTRNNVTAAGGLFVGRQFGSTTNDFYGHIADARITKGVARYTSAFTPSIKAFSLK